MGKKSRGVKKYKLYFLRSEKSFLDFNCLSQEFFLKQNKNYERKTKITLSKFNKTKFIG
jgi:hypothetical protein